MKKTHLYFTIHDIHGYGGTERVVINLCHLFHKLFDITIISYLEEKPNFLAPLPQDIKIIYLNHNFPKAFLSKLRFNRLINAKLSNERNIVIANCNHFFPFIKKAHTLYIRLEHYNFDFLFKKYRTKTPIYPRVRFFDVLVILSSFEQKLYAKLHANVRVIPNFLPHISEKNTDCNQHRILSVGRMDEKDTKGFLRLIEIWANVQEKIKQTSQDNLHSWQLVIVGDGVMREHIVSTIQAKNLQDTIILKPFTKDIESQYLHASIYAMSSHFEGFGMVLLEASAYALPCIAFDVATGPSNIIKHEESGYLIENGNIQEYANKLITLMSDKQKRESMGLCAKQRIKYKFSKDAIMPLWEDIFRKKQ